MSKYKKYKILQLMLKSLGIKSHISNFYNTFDMSTCKIKDRNKFINDLKRNVTNLKIYNEKRKFKNGIFLQTNIHFIFNNIKYYGHFESKDNNYFFIDCKDNDKIFCDICGKEIIGIDNFINAGDKVVCSKNCLDEAIGQFTHWQNTMSV